MRIIAQLQKAYKEQYSETIIKLYWTRDMAAIQRSEASGYAAGSDNAKPPVAAVAADVKAKLAEARVSFCPDPKTVGGKFTATFEKSPERTFASVNAGDEDFRVGGATLNGQFAKDLYDIGWQDTRKYAAFHNKLFSSAATGRLVAAKGPVVALNPNIVAGFVRRAAEKVGVAFIDVFKNKLRPWHANNVAMVYEQ